MNYLLFFLFIVTARCKPFDVSNTYDTNVNENPQYFIEFLKGINDNSYIKDFISLLDVVQVVSKNHSSPKVIRGVRTQAENAPIQISSRRIEDHQKMDDVDTTEKKSITQEEWANTLFGERGVLTGIFQMMDQQRKAKNIQNDNVPTLNGKKVDLKEVFDTLLMGPKKGELGDTGPELPEFLGICNRLSCGDIYKAIDKFRKSDFFSNFQTALGLVQDPNGWETLGKLLSNPELISQFTAGSGMEQIFGSALGEAKKESSKTQTKNSKLLPEDGDFGIDFSEDREDKEIKKDLPEIDFSVDSMRPETSDYYEEVSKGTNISPDYDQIEESVVDFKIPSSFLINKTATEMKKPIELGPTDISFSIDETGEEIVDMASTSKLGTSTSRITTIKTTKNTPQKTTYKGTTKTLKWMNSSTTTPKSTTTTRNYRKDSDYYAMYYDEQNH